MMSAFNMTVCIARPFDSMRGTAFVRIGPVVREANLVQDPHNLEINVYVNEQLIQTANTNELIRPIPVLLKDVTEFMTLYPGDVLMIGTPANMPFVHEGDKVRIRSTKSAAWRTRFFHSIV